jgi:predicted TIM-barrel fold metal-dependent hydrolase
LLAKGSLEEAIPLSRKFRLFDAHSHIGDFPEMNIYGRTTEDLLKYMDKFDIRRAAVSSITKRIKEDNDRVTEALQAYPDRFVGLAHIDPNSRKDAVTELERCLALGFRGIKLHPVWDNFRVIDLDMMGPLLDKASDNRLPIMIHTGNYPMSVPIHVAILAQQYPMIKFICAHMGVDSTAEAITSARLAENLYLETSGSSSAGEVEQAVRSIGAHRFLWGTDPPYGNFIAEFYKIISLNIGEKEKQQIFWDNATAIYGK